MELYDKSFCPGLRLSNLTAELIRAGRKAEAIACAIGACELEPNHPAPFANLAGAYDQVKGCEQFQLAAATEGLLNIDGHPPELEADLRHNMSLALNRLYRWEEAIEQSNRAHLLSPANPWILGHAAQLANELGHVRAGISMLTGVLNLIEGEGSPFLSEPTPVMRKFRRDTYSGRAIASLEIGDMEQYFSDFRRSRIELGEDPAAQFAKQHSPWRPGLPFPRRIKLFLEGGLGDQIQFVRLAQHVPAEVHVECNPVLADVASRIPWVRSVNQPVEGAVPVLSYDLVEWAYRGGIPQPFGAWPDVYIPVDGAAEIRRDPGKLAVAFCWQGNPDNSYDWARSMPLPAFLDWAEAQRDRCTFHSVQFGKKLFELPEWIEDAARPQISDLATVLNAADLVIGPDTGVMHLAGAMGRPALMLHSFHQEWRWRLGTQIYGPNFRHMKQNRRGDWAELLSRVGPVLDDLAPAEGAYAMAQ